MKGYKNIEFPKGFNIPFGDFKKRYETVKVFRDMYPDVRAKELIVAHKIACPKQYEKKVKDGNIATTDKKSRKTNSRKDS